MEYEEAIEQINQIKRNYLDSLIGYWFERNAEYSYPSYRLFLSSTKKGLYYIEFRKDEWTIVSTGYSIIEYIFDAIDDLKKIEESDIPMPIRVMFKKLEPFIQYMVE